MTMAATKNSAKFKTTLLSGGQTATGIVVPPEIVEALGSHKRPPVKVTIKGHTYRSTVAVMGGKFMVGVSAENREAAGIKAGDEIDVRLELDTEPREVVLPDDFKRALSKSAAARRHFEGLSYSKKRWYVLPIEGAKAPETRARRIEKAVEHLKDEASGK